jgi:hypothetical protein
MVSTNGVDMNAANIIRTGLIASVFAVAGIATSSARAADVQKFGRSSVYASAPATAAAKPFDGTTVTGNGRGSVYATGARATARNIAVSPRARTAPGNGRGSVYAWTNADTRS